MSWLRRLLRTPEGAAGFVILLVLLSAGLLAPVISPGDPLKIAGRALLAPFTDPAFPLGTDRLGRDLLAGLLYGARTSLAVGMFCVICIILNF